MNINYTWKKSSLIIMYLLCGNLVYAQYVELTFKDSKTNEVIPSVYIKAIKQNEKFETISNLDGKIKLPIKCDSIKTSHIAYESIAINKLEQDVVIFLTPRIQQLEDITVYSINLKEKFEYVLKNFSRLYVSGQHTYQCTYKDTYRVNDTLSRLLQFNMKWWDKNYNSKYKKPPLSQNQIGVGRTDYSKNRGRDIDNSSFDNNSFFGFLHLNNYLTALNLYGKNFIIDRIEKTEATTIIFFNALLETPKANKMKLSECKVIFDRKTGAILFLKTHLINDNHIEEGVSEEKKIPYKIHYLDEHRMMSFVKEKNKFRISQLSFQDNFEVEMLGKKDAIETELNIYVTKIEKGNTIPKSELIDLKVKSIHEFINKKTTNDPTILLTTEEQEFINEKNDNN